eukprot:7382103-Prymnesium_polylepis.1
MDAAYASLLKQLDISGHVPGAKTLFISDYLSKHKSYASRLFGRLLLDGRVSLSELPGLSRSSGAVALPAAVAAVAAATDSSEAAATPVSVLPAASTMPAPPEALEAVEQSTPSATAELTAGDLALLTRAARSAPGGGTVALVFGTADFLELLLNWACHALRAGVRWFVLVAMDAQLHSALAATPLHGQTLYLPRARDGSIVIDKMSIIGERQRFGLRVLEAGLSIVHSDADALWLRDPWPVLRAGDVVSDRATLTAERIWGKPPSVVRSWGAAICTGFYYMRSGAPAIALAREVQRQITERTTSTPSWQASDQLVINTVRCNVWERSLLACVALLAVHILTASLLAGARRLGRGMGLAHKDGRYD